MTKRANLLGRVFGTLTVVAIASSLNGRSAWKVKCSCGTSKDVSSEVLVSGRAMSCGCQRGKRIGDRIRTHGASSNSTDTGLRRAHGRYKTMLARCYNPSCNSYARYGARGIKVCKRWRNSFENFLADMGMPPSGLSLDRKDNNGDYTPDNCRWATAQQQQQANSSNARLINTPSGRLCLAEAARKYPGVNKHTLCSRLGAGWTAEDALFKPIRRTKRSGARETG